MAEEARSQRTEGAQEAPKSAEPEAADPGVALLADSLEQLQARSGANHEEEEEEVEEEGSGAIAVKGAPCLEQVKVFSSAEEVERILEAEGLSRTLLVKLGNDTDFEGSYVKGKVITKCPKTNPKDGTELLLTDESLFTLDKYVTCHLEGQAAKQYPELASMNYYLYLHRAEVCNTCTQFSQDLELCIVVKKSDARVWIVHSDGARVLQQGVEKKGRRRRKKRGREALMGETSVSMGSNEPGYTHSEATEQPSTEGQSKMGVPSIQSEAQSSVMVQSEPASILGPSQQAQYLDDCSFPDSASISSQTQGQSHEDANGEERESSEEIVDSDSRSESESESESSNSSEGFLSSSDDYQPRRKKRKIEGKQYDFKKVADLRAGDKKANVCGVISQFKPHFVTRGRCHCSTFTIIDESCPEDGVKCVFFNDNRERLPQVHQNGDIVSLHRINVSEFGGRPCADGVQFSSSLCFSGEIGASLKPRTGYLSYTLTSQDKNRVRELREWSARRARGIPVTCKLEDVTSDCHFNLICQVVAITSCLPQCSAVVLTVWDGTRMPLKQQGLDLSQYRSVSDVSLYRASEQMAVHIILYHSSLAHPALSLLPGQYLTILNIFASTVQGLTTSNQPEEIVELCVSSESALSTDNVQFKLLDASEPLIRNMKVRLDRLVNEASSNGRDEMDPSGISTDIIPSYQVMPGASSFRAVTTVLHPNRPLVSLSYVQSYQTVPMRFRCRVKVVGFSPACVEELVSVKCPTCEFCVTMDQRSSFRSTALLNMPCENCAAVFDIEPDAFQGELSSLCYFFKMKVLLEDDSGKLAVYAVGERARTFLGVEPANFYLDQQARQEVLSRLYFLTGGNDPFISCESTNPRPFIDCCISSAYSGGSTRFLLFDTVLNYLD